jgi:hypothetical protein
MRGPPIIARAAAVDELLPRVDDFLARVDEFLTHVTKTVQADFVRSAGVVDKLAQGRNRDAESANHLHPVVDELAPDADGGADDARASAKDTGAA